MIDVDRNCDGGGWNAGNSCWYVGNNVSILMSAYFPFGERRLLCTTLLQRNLERGPGNASSDEAKRIVPSGAKTEMERFR